MPRHCRPPVTVVWLDLQFASPATSGRKNYRQLSGGKLLLVKALSFRQQRSSSTSLRKWPAEGFRIWVFSIRCFGKKMSSHYNNCSVKTVLFQWTAEQFTVPYCESVDYSRSSIFSTQLGVPFAQACARCIVNEAACKCNVVPAVRHRRIDGIRRRPSDSPTTWRFKINV